jgi:hypothetical protein
MKPCTTTKNLDHYVVDFIAPNAIGGCEISQVSITTKHMTYHHYKFITKNNIIIYTSDLQG